MKARTPAQAYEDGLKKGLELGACGMVHAFTVVMHDKYGYRKQRLKKLHRFVNTQWEAILSGHMTYDELEALAKECFGGKIE